MDLGQEGGYCFTSYQRLNIDILTRARWIFRATGQSFYNYGATVPSADNRIYPWLNTTDGLWYIFTGGYWASPRRFPPESTFGMLWLPAPGTPESALWSLDGGDGTDPSIGGNVTAFTGAMWEVIPELAGKMPVGVGTLQPSATAIVVGDTAGVDEVTLTAAQIAKHTHLVDNADRVDGSDTWVHFDPGGGGPGTVANPLAPTTVGGPQTTLIAKAPTDGDGSHDNMPPYYTVQFIRPTARKYYSIPG